MNATLYSLQLQWEISVNVIIGKVCLHLFYIVKLVLGLLLIFITLSFLAKIVDIYAFLVAETEK